MPNYLDIPIIVTLLAACVAAITDIWRFRVYNAFTVPLALTGFAYHVFTGGWNGVQQSCGGMLLGFILLVIPYALGLLGAGDVKLLAAIGAWLGVTLTYMVFVTSTLLLGIYATIVVVVTGNYRETWMMLKIILWRCAVFGVHIAKDDLLEAAERSTQRRLKLIPFAAAFPFGILATLAWYYVTGGGA